jgi:hypothetical protein
MGINIGTASLLAKSNLIEFVKKENMNHGCNLLMIGRQTMSTTNNDIEKLIQFNSNILPNSLEKGKYAEDFLTQLGANEIKSLDVSDFEHAELIHNLNETIENSQISKFKSSFDLILDYGSSEHVFQAAQSISNSINLLKIGGFLNMVLPVCGWLEHGFYQFSPNFFRALDDGCLKLIQMYIYDPYGKKIIIFNSKNLPNLTFYEKLDGRFLCWTVYKKISELDEKNFLFNTQQGVYKRAWENKKNIEILKQSNFSVFKNKMLTKYTFLKKYFILKKKITIDDVERL